MKTVLLTGVTIAMFSLSTATFADSEHHKNGEMQKPMPGMSQSKGDKGTMDMAAMHDSMARMQETMKKIHDTKDPKQRQKLMQQHMQEMQKGMGMMQPATGGGMMDHGKKGHGESSGGMMEGGKKGHGMMEQRMDMMQEMLNQAMEHMKVQQGMDMH